MCAYCMIETKGHSLEFIEQRYSERQSNAKVIGRWWNFGKQIFELHHVNVVQRAMD